MNSIQPFHSHNGDYNMVDGNKISIYDFYAFGMIQLGIESVLYVRSNRFFAAKMVQMAVTSAFLQIR